ncbi:MAG TPA: hypothetical protein VFF27_00535 [Bacteroidia bacterium]|jgi:hypothetical protein|nr:hypothetical protein [Bacteroidia bacterium]
MSLENNHDALKELSAQEKQKKLSQEYLELQQKEHQEVSEKINAILKEYGYQLSARMILEAGKAPIVQPFIVKVQ